jgi:hypothetical protein
LLYRGIGHASKAAEDGSSKTLTVEMSMGPQCVRFTDRGLLVEAAIFRVAQMMQLLIFDAHGVTIPLIVRPVLVTGMDARRHVGVVWQADNAEKTLAEIVDVRSVASHLHVDESDRRFSWSLAAGMVLSFILVGWGVVRETVCCVQDRHLDTLSLFLSLSRAQGLKDRTPKNMLLLRDMTVLQVHISTVFDKDAVCVLRPEAVPEQIQKRTVQLARDIFAVMRARCCEWVPLVLDLDDARKIDEFLNDRLSLQLVRERERGKVSE